MIIIIITKFDMNYMMWSGKTGLEKSQIKPEITHPYETRTKKVHQ